MADNKQNEDKKNKKNKPSQDPIAAAYRDASAGIDAAANTANNAMNKNYIDLLQQSAAEGQMSQAQTGAVQSDTLAAQNEMAGYARAGALKDVYERNKQQTEDAATTATGMMKAAQSNAKAAQITQNQSEKMDTANTTRDSLYTLFANRRITSKQFKNITGIAVKQYAPVYKKRVVRKRSVKSIVDALKENNVKLYKMNMDSPYGVPKQNNTVKGSDGNTYWYKKSKYADDVIKKTLAQNKKKTGQSVLQVSENIKQSDGTYKYKTNVRTRYENPDEDYGALLKNLSKNKKDYIKYGQEYNAALKYLSAKYILQVTGQKQSSVLPGYDAMDNLMNGGAEYIKKYGSASFESAYRKIDKKTTKSVNKLISTYEKAVGKYSFDAYVLNAAPLLNKTFTYGTDLEDQMRMKLGRTPKEFTEKDAVKLMSMARDTLQKGKPADLIYSTNPWVDTVHPKPELLLGATKYLLDVEQQKAYSGDLAQKALEMPDTERITAFQGDAQQKYGEVLRDEMNKAKAEYERISAEALRKSSNGQDNDKEMAQMKDWDSKYNAANKKLQDFEQQHAQWLAQNGPKPGDKLTPDEIDTLKAQKQELERSLGYSWDQEMYDKTEKEIQGIDLKLAKSSRAYEKELNSDKLNSLNQYYSNVKKNPDLADEIKKGISQYGYSSDDAGLNQFLIDVSYNPEYIKALGVDQSSIYKDAMTVYDTLHKNNISQAADKLEADLSHNSTVDMKKVQDKAAEAGYGTDKDSVNKYIRDEMAKNENYEVFDAYSRLDNNLQNTVDHAISQMDFQPGETTLKSTESIEAGVRKEISDYLTINKQLTGNTAQDKDTIDKFTESILQLAEAKHDAEQSIEWKLGIDSIRGRQNNWVERSLGTVGYLGAKVGLGVGEFCSSLLTTAKDLVKYGIIGTNALGEEIAGAIMGKPFSLDPSDLPQYSAAGIMSRGLDSIANNSSKYISDQEDWTKRYAVARGAYSDTVGFIGDLAQSATDTLLTVALIAATDGIGAVGEAGEALEAAKGTESAFEIASKELGSSEKAMEAVTKVSKIIKPETIALYGEEYGKNKNAAIRDGASEKDATLYAINAAAINTALNYGDYKELAAEFASSTEAKVVMKAGLKEAFHDLETTSAKKIMSDIFKSGVQGSVQQTLEALDKKLTYKKDMPWIGKGGVLDSESALKAGKDEAIDSAFVYFAMALPKYTKSNHVAKYAIAKIKEIADGVVKWGEQGKTVVAKSWNNLKTVLAKLPELVREDIKNPNTRQAAIDNAKKKMSQKEIEQQIYADKETDKIIQSTKEKIIQNVKSVKANKLPENIENKQNSDTILNRGPEQPPTDTYINADQAKANKRAQRADILVQNREKNRKFEEKEYSDFRKKYLHTQKNITIKTHGNYKIRIDVIGLDANGNIVIHQYKSSKKAKVTPKQKAAFDELYQTGGTVAGKGKGIFTNGYNIPAGTAVKITRPK